MCVQTCKIFQLSKNTGRNCLICQFLSPFFAKCVCVLFLILCFLKESTQMQFRSSLAFFVCLFVSFMGRGKKRGRKANQTLTLCESLNALFYWISSRNMCTDRESLQCAICWRKRDREIERERQDVVMVVWGRFRILLFHIFLVWVVLLLLPDVTPSYMYV